MPRFPAALTLLLALAACRRESVPPTPRGMAAAPVGGDVAPRLARYATVTLTTDTAALTPNERKMIPLLIDAAREMDPIFWREAYGDRDSLMRQIASADARRFVDVNDGPWDRLENDAPFIPEIGPKPAGANFYPPGMTKEEFDSAAATSKPRGDSLRSQYTMVRRDAGGRLIGIPYSTIFAAQHQRAADKLLEAATLADDPGLKHYLTLRAAALRNDDYQPSDFAWMDMKHNTLDIVIGPIETYEDALFGYKAAHEGIVVVKDQQWSKRLGR
jgi:hypothetical protein